MTPDVWRALVLGALQGATEFLPISSSGHLIIVPELLGWPASSLTFDVVVHWATALAVVTYFRRDWLALARGARNGLWSRSARHTPEVRLPALLALATIPAAIAGALLADPFDELLRTDPRAMARFAAVMLLVTGVLLTASELLAKRRSSELARLSELGWGAAAAIGVAQALAIAPGISRSGATMAAGLTVGAVREQAARFSFLLAAPIMVGAGAHQLLGFAAESPTSAEVLSLAVGFVVAAVVGYVCIGWLMAYVRRSPLYVFAAYTFAAGLISLWLLRGPAPGP
ncbi:MAG: undecaprenyl-diphosphate phosphatase [Anaerolineae bacterium]